MSDYKSGYLDAIFERQRIANHTFMYNAGFDAGVEDLAKELEELTE